MMSLSFLARYAPKKVPFALERREGLINGWGCLLGIVLSPYWGLGFMKNSQAADAPVEHMMTSGRLRTMQEMLNGVQGHVIEEAQLLKKGIALHLSILADNGNSVPLGVSVDSPMTPDHHVQDIYLLSQRNPVLVMAHLHLGPWNGRAELNTRVRLAGTQKVVALAHTNTGQWLIDSADIIVTESACVDASN
jgi:sulfur-oxidizing protein SoxY